MLQPITTAPQPNVQPSLPAKDDSGDESGNDQSNSNGCYQKERWQLSPAGQHPPWWPEEWMGNNTPEPNVETPAQGTVRTKSLAVGSPVWWQGVMDSGIPDPMDMLQRRQH